MRRLTTPILVALAVLFVTVYAAAQNRPVQFVVHANEYQLSLYESLMERFTEETGIPVEIIAPRGGQQGKWQQIITLVAGGVSPDVVSGVSLEFNEFAVKGLLRPLDDLMSRDQVDMDGLIPPIVEALQWNGRQYMLPYGASALVVYYNIHHFDQAGLPYPPREWNTPDWTYEAFVDTARKLTSYDSEGRVLQYGISGPMLDSWFTLPYPWGGRWISKDLRTFVGTSEETIASVQSLQDLIHQYRVMPTSGAQLHSFVTGFASIAGLGTWNLVQVSESDQEWDFMPWFRVKDSAQAAINPVGYGILTTSPNPEGAWELIKWLTWNEQANLDYAVAAGAVPALMSNVPDWSAYWGDRIGRPVALDVVIAQVAQHGATIDIRRSPAFWTIDPIMNRVTADVMNNRTSAFVALHEAAGQIQALIDAAMVD